jgi:hypothetical protein
MPGSHLVLAHSPKCSSDLRVFGRQLRRVNWELPNRLISAFSSANSEKKSRIVAQLLAQPRRRPYSRQSSLKLRKDVLTFIAFTPVKHTQGNCLES